MSHAPTARTPTSVSPGPDDPFRIGWREVRRPSPEGDTIVEQVPLTLDDALHPQEGDVIVMNTAHNRDWRYLQGVFEQRVADDAHALVLGDCKVLWEDGVHHCPDLAVVFGIRDVHDYYSQFDIVAEGVRPRLIVEVVSPSTRVNDVETKVAHYHRYRVPLYVIVDRPGDDSPPQLFGYQFTRQRYLPMPIDEDGQLWLEPLGISLGVRGDRVVAYSGDSGQELGDYVAVSAALEAEQIRADAEKQRADAEQQRADAAERLLISERQQSEAAENRAAAELQRAEAAETRLRQLEAEFLARQPPPPPSGS